MDKVIDKLIDIENRAQSVVREAKELRSNIDKLIDENAEKMADDIAQRKIAKQQAVAGVESDGADSRIAEIKKRMAEAEEKMDKTRRQHESEWVEAIFSEVIKS